MLCGIFVGGKATRMGGLPKGLLPAPDTGEPLVIRLARLARELDCEPVLVGDDLRYRAALPQLRTLEDVPANVGPLGGLGGLLTAAEGGCVLALACDLPRISAALLARLISEQADAAVLAPRSESGLWEPLCARYRADLVLPRLTEALAAGTRSFQRLFHEPELEVVELVLDEESRAELVDWDTPADVATPPPDRAR